MNLLKKISTLLIDTSQSKPIQAVVDPETPLDQPERPPEMSYQTTDQEAASGLKEKIIAHLREVYDPEIPVNIYELGLIYALNVDTANNVDIHMTLTAPGCPVAPMIINQVETKVGAIPEINQVNIELVWDPPWTEDMMTDEAKLEVGIF